MRTYRVRIRRVATIVLERAYDLDEDNPDAAVELAIKHAQYSDPRESDWEEPDRFMDCHLEWAPDLNHDCYLVEEIE